NAPPKQASAVGGIRRWKDGRNMPDVHAVVYDYDGLPVYMRLNLGTEMPEMYRIQGSKGLLEVTGSSLSFTPQTGKDQYPSYYTGSYPRALRDAYLAKWHQDNDPKIGQQVAMPETISFSGPDFDDVRPHLWTFFEAVRTRKPVVEDVVFGHHAALACQTAAVLPAGCHGPDGPRMPTAVPAARGSSSIRFRTGFKRFSDGAP